MRVGRKDSKRTLLKGFTLIELLIVVIIIGVLATIAMPMFSKTVETSRASRAVNTLGALRMAEKIYYEENNGAYTDTDQNLIVKFPTDDPYWTYGLSLKTGKVGFVGRATRKNKTPQEYITYDEDAVWGGNHVGVPKE